jgi:hypothetical protein
MLRRLRSPCHERALHLPLTGDHQIPAHDLAEKLDRALTDLAETRQQLGQERRLNTVLRQAIAELTIELEHTRGDTTHTADIVRLPKLRHRPVDPPV